MITFNTTIIKIVDEQHPRVPKMFKWLVQWLKRFFLFSFGNKQTYALTSTREQQVVQSLPELTNADLEFLFTQLLEGVYQARGQQWALKYLERMEDRISNQRWIDWLLDFGEKLLLSPAPNAQLAERMVQLGELGIGTIGELAHDIGMQLLSRNLNDEYWDNDEQAEPEQLTQDLDEPISQNHEQPLLAVPPEASICSLNELAWEYDRPVPDAICDDIEDEGWVQKTLQAAVSDLQPVTITALDELLVKLEPNSSIVQQLDIRLETQQRKPQVLSLPEAQAQEWFYQGLQQAKTGDLIGAIASYNQAVAINPNSHEYWFNRGLTLFYLGRFSDAIASYDKAIALKPDFYKAWYNRGAAMGEMGYFEDAIACFDKAIAIKFDYYDAWSSWGMVLLKLERPWDAVSCYDKALIMQPQDPENWYYRGFALAESGRSHDAIASFDKAIEVQPDFYLAWYNRGVELSRLERWEDAIASLEQAVQIQPDFYEAVYAWGGALDKLGHTEQALAAYEQATQLQPNAHIAWVDKGVVLANLGRWQDAIASWEVALDIQPDFYLAWFNKAVALANLGRQEEAIYSYNKAVEINPDFYLAWFNRGVALFSLQKFEESIASYDKALQIKLDYWEAWIGRGAAAGYAVNYDSHLGFFSDLAASHPTLCERGYEGKLASYKEGLRYVNPQTYPEGWGRLHLALGNAYYEQGKRHSTPRWYWEQAVAEYDWALTTLTAEASPQLHLEVLQNLVKTLLSLGQIQQAQFTQQSAIDLLRQLLSASNDSCESKKQLALKNAGFWQLAVDIAVQTGELAQALEIAEQGKNAHLTWLLFGWQDVIATPNYDTIQQLLTPTTAIVYWHISPCALRTFVLKHKSPEPIPIFTPVLNVGEYEEMPLPEAVERLVAFEDWLEEWNQQCKKYGAQTHGREDKNQSAWQAQMLESLLKLKNILNINAIQQELENINQVILIPHRELHKLPLHALFELSSLQELQISQIENLSHCELWSLPNSAAKYTITYLPSIQMGLSLKHKPLGEKHELSLLSVEHPHTAIASSSGLKFAKLEAEVINQIFSNCKRIQGTHVTKYQVKNALTDEYKILHFIGYETESFNNPQKSEMILADGENLTLEEICQQNLSNFYLITLATHKTIIPSRQPILTEYVGLVSGFISRGVTHVISTLWTVDSVASALVGIEFYRRLQQAKSPAIALAEATQWLKEVTAGELKQWYEDLLNKLPQEGLRIKAHLATELYKSSRVPVDTKPYNHPYFWAAFTITGTLM